MSIAESLHQNVAGADRRRNMSASVVRQHATPSGSSMDAVRRRVGNSGTQTLVGSLISPVEPASRGAEVQRLCTGCEDETRTTNVQRKETAANSPPVTSAVADNVNSLRGGGSPMAASTRAFFEPRFGADFSQVRLHTDPRAADTARSINAKAFTVGNDIAFSAGQYAPGSHEGQRLLAHELTHVVQQQGDQIRRDPGDFLDDLGNDLKDLENLGKGLAKEVEEQIRQQLRALGAQPGTGALFTKSGCPKDFCNPFKNVSQAKTDLLLVAPVLLAGIAKVVSPRVVPLWKDYLFGGSSPQNLTASFAADFTGSKTTKLTTEFIIQQLKIEIAANHKAILPGTGPVTLDLTPRMPKTLAAIDNQKHPHAMDFNQIGEIAGNIAGGIGKDQLSNPIGAKPSPFDDDRTATITAELTRTSTGIHVKPSIVFTIHDTIDLCPGNCGALTEQDATIPMSRFEATGLSGDVPFEIEFPAPASSLGAFDIPVGGTKPKGGGKPKGPSKGKSKPSKPKSGGKTSELSESEPKEALVLEETGKSAGAFDEIGPGLIAEEEVV